MNEDFLKPDNLLSIAIIVAIAMFVSGFFVSKHFTFKQAYYVGERRGADLQLAKDKTVLNSEYDKESSLTSQLSSSQNQYTTLRNAIIAYLAANHSVSCNSMFYGDNQFVPTVCR